MKRIAFRLSVLCALFVATFVVAGCAPPRSSERFFNNSIVYEYTDEVKDDMRRSQDLYVEMVGQEKAWLDPYRVRLWRDADQDKNRLLEGVEGRDFHRGFSDRYLRSLGKIDTTPGMPDEDKKPSVRVVDETVARASPD